MKKKALLFSFVMLTASSVFAQVGVNTETPSATLDVNASTSTTSADGIIAPRVTLANLITKNAIYTPAQAGAIVYVTDITGTTNSKTSEITSTGYYYYNGTAWQSIGGRVVLPTEPWQVQGTTNEATSNTANIFQTGKVAIGANTSGDKQLHVQGDAKITGSSELGTGVVVTSTGNIGVGTTTPAAQLSLNGDSDTKQIFSLRDVQTTASADGYSGKVLTADAFGNGSWVKAGAAYAIMGKITTNTGDDYESSLDASRTAYTGMFVDLPAGTYQINFTCWFSTATSNTGGITSIQRFSSVFFGKSSAISSNPIKYTTPIKSVILNPTYSGSYNDFYGSGAIPVEVTAEDIANYGAANMDPDGTIPSSITDKYPKAEGTLRVYLWGYLSNNVGATTLRSRNNTAGQFGPYTQLYAISFAVQN